MKESNTSLKQIMKNIGMVMALLSLSSVAVADWTTNGNQLIDPSGKPFIFRGVTIDHTLAPEKTVQAIADAAALGANAVQLEIAANIYNRNPLITSEQLSQIIQACKDSKVVCVLEPNDSAGYPNAPGSASPSAVAGFWLDGAIRQAMSGQQDYVMVGLGNQALDGMPVEEYLARMETYASELKAILPGFMLMVDGSHWGQDTDKAMHALATRAQHSGLANNLVYSVEMSAAYTDPEKVREYIASFAQIGAPLVVGFAIAPYYHPFYHYAIPAVALRLPAESVMQYAEEYGAGYFAWNWSGIRNFAFDLTDNWDANALTPWGELVFNSPHGIKATAKLAGHFSSSASSSSSSSSSAVNQPPQAVIEGGVVQLRCGNVVANLSAGASSDPDMDSLTYAWEVTDSYSTPAAYFSGPNISFSMWPVRNYTVVLTVNDGEGGTSTATKQLSHYYSDYCTGSSYSSSSVRSSSSAIATSSSSILSSASSLSPSSRSSARSSSSSPAVPATANCAYVITSQWTNGFTAAIRIKNTSGQTINGWSVNWQYGDASKVTNSWNATLTGGNPYSAKNLGWNATIQPGQTAEFGFQGNKPAGAAAVPVITGNVCQ